MTPMALMPRKPVEVSIPGKPFDPFWVVISPHTVAIDNEGGRKRVGARITIAHRLQDCCYLRDRDDLIQIAGPIVEALGVCAVCERRYQASKDDGREWNGMPGVAK